MTFILHLLMTALVAAVTRATGHNDIRPLIGQRVTTGMIQEAGMGQGGRGAPEEQTESAAVSSLADSKSWLSVNPSVAVGKQGQHSDCGNGLLTDNSLKLN